MSKLEKAEYRIWYRDILYEILDLQVPIAMSFEY